MKMRVAARGRRGGIATRVKDRCHTEPGLKVGQLSEGQQRDEGPTPQIASLSRCVWIQD